MNWKNKLDFGDAQMFPLIENGKACLVLCFKSVHVNNYSVIIVDLKTKMIVFRHESEHMWEASIRSFLLQTNELIILSNTGMFALNLTIESNKKSKVIGKENNIQKVMHPLSSCNDLRLEDSNHVLF